MSLLDRKIRRVKAQRACLDHAVALIQTRPGPILELGLGNGRTYHHLGQLLTNEGLGREIFVFEREVAAHPDCVPGRVHLFLGDFQETLGLALTRLGPVAVLAHADFGSADEEATAATSRVVARALPRLLTPGALVASDQDIPFAEAESLPLPRGVEPGWYFLWQLPKAAESGVQTHHRRAWSKSSHRASQYNPCSTRAGRNVASRLDSFIRRLEAQRNCLDLAADLVRGLEGPVLELGLGNGRTYDHLRALLPEHEIFVFDRRVKAFSNCVPDRKHLILGDIRDTLPAAVRRFRRSVVLVHSDMGSGNREASIRLAAFIASQLPGLMRPGGLVVADEDEAFERSNPVPLPDGVRPGRYFMYRAS
ncbi:MAG: class I SAM-dependent methyltransferase [Acidiferrobacterales bacterium]